MFGGERGIGGLVVWWSKRDWLFGGERGIGGLVVWWLKRGLVVWWLRRGFPSTLRKNHRLNFPNQSKTTN